MTVKPNLFNTGIRPAVDEYIQKKREEERNYGEYWSASSAGYCMRRVIFERLKIPYVKEEARKQRVFSAGDIFHEWIQRITKNAALSMGQEILVEDKDLMIRGHVDDLINIDNHFIVYDYKSAHSRSFSYAKDRPMSYYHKMQLGTYLYMLHQPGWQAVFGDIKEGRVMKISKDDLRMLEHQLLYTPALEKEVVAYWKSLNSYWNRKKLPKCTCDKYEGGFMAREAYNPFWYKGEPCSIEWYSLNINKEK